MFFCIISYTEINPAEQKRKGMVITMKNDLKRAFIIGALAVAILGTLCHFVYDWTGQNRLVGLFVPVNESTWEHMKLLFFPMLLATWILTLRLREEYPTVLSGMLAGTLIGTAMIPVLFYTYTGILGFHISAVDIAIFYICLVLGFWTAYRLTSSGKVQDWLGLCVCLTLAMAAAFLLFTFHPLSLGIFAEPAESTFIHHARALQG
jgi:hypothetical protein